MVSAYKPRVPFINQDTNPKPKQGRLQPQLSATQARPHSGLENPPRATIPRREHPSALEAHQPRQPQYPTFQRHHYLPIDAGVPIGRRCYQQRKRGDATGLQTPEALPNSLSDCRR